MGLRPVTRISATITTAEHIATLTREYPTLYAKIIRCSIRHMFVAPLRISMETLVIDNMPIAKGISTRTNKWKTIYRRVRETSRMKAVVVALVISGTGSIPILRLTIHDSVVSWM